MLKTLKINAEQCFSALATLIIGEIFLCIPCILSDTAITLFWNQTFCVQIFLGKIICLHNISYSRKNNKSIKQIHLNNVKIITYIFSSIAFKNIYRHIDLTAQYIWNIFFINIEHKQSLCHLSYVVLDID